MRTWFESQQKPTYVVRDVTPGGVSGGGDSLRR
jgi:hypothetical protein